MVPLLAHFPDVGLVELSKLLNYPDAEPQDVAGRTSCGYDFFRTVSYFFRECGYDDTVGFDGFSDRVDSCLFLSVFHFGYAAALQPIYDFLTQACYFQ